MNKPLAGIRILEVASHVFVPIAGGVLHEWGADIIKIEHPETGDPYRGLVTSGLHSLHNGVDASFQFTNRGKQSVAIDLKCPAGLDLLYRIAKDCDVFLTNMRPDARRRLKIDVAQIRACNPAIIYVRGSGYGPRGPDAQTGGYDATSYWSRAGIGTAFTAPGAEEPVMSRPAFGDVMGGLTIAGAISTALYQRLATGEAPVIDVSLFNVGLWQLQPDITHAPGNAGLPARVYDRRTSWNPLSASYRTSDGRFIKLNMLDADRYWTDFCTVIGHPELIDDPRFVDMPARKANAAACVDLLDRIFAGRDYAEWCTIMQAAKGVWAPMQTPLEVHDDPQALANGYLADVEMANGTTLKLVTAPVQFNEIPARPVRAPELGEHTESVLLDIGLSWDDIARLKDSGAIG
ncbi:MAG TPA: CoA transferase [Novosphingobium sp.]|nr:CoA transferase [Novosphingobium sp.]